jgi:lipopolysaccharide assembly outer membrane protein LptD (OstA)
MSVGYLGVMKVYSLRRILLATVISGASTLAAVLTAASVQAQVPPPDRQTWFSEDSKTAKKEESERMRKATGGVATAAPGVDFQAPVIEFDRNKNEISGKGGVTISDSGVQVQADEGTFNTQTRQGVVAGNVVVSSSAGILAADAATLHVPNETGEFTNLNFEVEEGGFDVVSAKARKVSEFDFELEDSSVTSCHCPDGAKPWEIRSDTCKITQEGYAHSYDSSVYFEGLPIFYSPYLAFPVKNERASGLLPPQWGVSNQNGVLYRQPILGIVDGSSDFTVSPFIATKTRVGAALDGERVFSRTHRVNGGFIYSNESLRGDSLRGLDIEDTYDPTIDTNRTGGYYKQRWTPDPKLELPLEFVADGRYTSDNIFLREIPAPEIGEKQSQFLTSTAVLRGRVLEAINAEARAEYNQMLLTDQDVQTQRLPELTANTGTTFRPFGFNPYGLKLVTNAGVTATDFVRQDGYDGWRTDIVPKASIPFHISNYMKGDFSAELHQTEYSLRDTMLPSTATPLPDGSKELASSSDRTLPILSYGMQSGVERVFEVDRGGTFARLVNLGARNERSDLVRLKHTIEPDVRYTYIPDVDQEYNPLFDQIDRYRNRSLVSYGFSSRLYGRFMEPYERVRDIEELSPQGESLPMVDLGSSVLDFGRNMLVAPTQNIDLRSGDIRQLALFTVRQTYDFLDTTQGEQDDPTSDDNNDGLDQFSDVNLGLSLSPSKYFSTGAQTNYGIEDADFSSYSLSLGFMDDREDMIRARYIFIDDTDEDPNVDNGTGQLEGNVEIALHQRLRAGGYLRLDAKEGEVIESRALLRFINSCRCWSADLGFGQTNNPDQSQVLVGFTFGGLGGIRQGVGLTPSGSN